ncbi:MAG: hypothetical protein ABIC68_00430 [Candidatus Omnitrophota bacterium]
MVGASFFILLGFDENGKRQRIESLQEELFPPELKEFNYAIVYGDDKRLTIQGFKELLMSLPTQGASKRLLVVKAAHKLKKNFIRCLKELWAKVCDGVVVVLDVDELKAGNTLAAEFSSLGVQVIRFKSQADISVFDLGRSILQHESQASLCILDRLLKSRERADKILGAIFWQWEHARSNQRLREETYDKGLRFILDADKKLKSSSSAFARQTLILESLTVKLSYLT